ncbi:4'-phosphopantetheinyl transferase superfamily protein [Pedobacter sp. Du54]|uniref:4'-phosphopantetheinyl transferase family protein n=1 Tax=Pedobacter anseongensis TaxID=3133439 RepID=UPI0030A7D6D2
MLGNDIVDLKSAQAQSNWRRKGYLAKIFTAEEQEHIGRATHPDQMIWLLWSMKESTYKITNRACLQRFYSPTKFSCQLSGADGLVHFKGRKYYTKSVINDDLIHTIASSKKEKLKDIKTYYSANKTEYALEFNSKFPAYFLEKDINGIPNLINKLNGESCLASISHHGKYVAIVYML